MTLIDILIKSMRNPLIMYTYLNCHVYFKYLAILSGKYIIKKLKKEKKQEFQCFLYNFVISSDVTLGM